MTALDEIAAERRALFYVRDLVDRGVASIQRTDLLSSAERLGFVKLWPGPYGTLFFKTLPAFGCAVQEATDAG